MEIRNKGNHSQLTQQDCYYEGFIDGIENDFCEDSQMIVGTISGREQVKLNTYEASEDIKEYIEYTKFLNDCSDDHYLKLMRGELKRINYK